MIKLDMEKAFYEIHWPLLFQVLTQLGFHPHFIAWLKSCIVNPHFVLLVNGPAMLCFNHHEGSDKGIPFHHIFLLFILKSSQGFHIMLLGLIFLKVIKFQERDLM